jgi:hypothetical protein
MKTPHKEHLQPTSLSDVLPEAPLHIRIPELVRHSLAEIWRKPVADIHLTDLLIIHEPDVERLDLDLVELVVDLELAFKAEHAEGDGILRDMRHCTVEEIAKALIGLFKMEEK